MLIEHVKTFANADTWTYQDLLEFLTVLDYWGEVYHPKILRLVENAQFQDGCTLVAIQISKIC
jgi:hypothetical protein